MTAPTPGTTIAACATVLRPAERAIVRLSGPRALACAAAVFAPFAGKLDAATRRPGLVPGQFSLPLAGRIAAVEGWLLIFRAPKSYTAEELVELHLPGAPVVVEAVLQALYAAGATAAQPGEFTRRAVLNGRMNLAEAQATLVAIHGQDAADLRIGARLLGGETQAAVQAVRGELLNLLADVEAGLDFSGEDIEIIADDAVVARLTAIGARLARERQAVDPHGGDGRRELTGLLPRVALIGPTGGGKSTLFNRLMAGEITPNSAGAPTPAAATSAAPVAPENHFDVLTASAPDQRHTTRDVLAREWRCGATPAVLADLPGLGVTTADQALEREAIDAGLRWARSADVLLFLVDSAAPAAAPADDWAAVAHALQLAGDPRTVAWVLNKCDCLPPGAAATLPAGALAAGVAESAPQWAISARSGAGVAALQAWLETALQAVETPTAAIGDQVRHLTAAETALTRGIAAVAEGQELAALAIREALQELDHALHLRLSADERTEAMLDRLFARFCLGK